MRRFDGPPPQQDRAYNGNRESGYDRGTRYDDPRDRMPSRNAPASGGYDDRRAPRGGGGGGYNDYRGGGADHRAMDSGPRRYPDSRPVAYDAPPPAPYLDAPPMYDGPPAYSRQPRKYRLDSILSSHWCKLSNTILIEWF